MTKRPESNQPIPWATAAAGLVGAAGVAAAPAAAHGAEARLLGAASTIYLANAPALLVLGIAGRRLRLSTLGSALLMLGTVLFAGDLVLPSLLGAGLLPMAAVAGSARITDAVVGDPCTVQAPSEHINPGSPAPW